MKILVYFFIAFHLVSFGACLLALHMTFSYLSRYTVVSKRRQLLFGFLRTRHVGFLYLLFVLLVTVFSLAQLFFLKI